MPAAPASTSGQLAPPWRLSRVLLGLLAIAALIALLHGPSARFGLFMDDYAHYQQLRDSGWSLRDLTDSCRLELVGGVIEFWWMPECTLRFFRPLSFAMMKLTYTLTGWDADLGPFVAHFVSLGWHFVVCGLLLALLRVLGCRFGVAWLAVALFAIHPGHVATVQWIAAQTELLVTVFLLGATLCYARARGWQNPIGPQARAVIPAQAGIQTLPVIPSPVNTRAVIPAQAGIQVAPTVAGVDPRLRGDDGSRRGDDGSRRGDDGSRRGDDGGFMRWGWALAALILFAGALGCRENAIMFPAVMLSVELFDYVAERRRSATDRGKAHQSKWAARLSLVGASALVAIAYLGLRQWMLGGAALPPKPYIIPPSDPDFLAFVFDKARYYLLGEFLLVPCVPIGGLAYFREHGLTFAALSVLSVAILTVGAWRAWPSRAAVLGAAALIAYMAPVLPAFESPHHLYLPSIGWVIVIAGALGGFRRPAAAPDAAAPRAKGLGAARVMACGMLAVSGVLTYFFSLALEAAGEVEDRVVDEVLSSPAPVKDGDTLYFANLPMIAHYVKLAVELRAGLRDLRVVGLCWAPRLLGVTGPSELRRLDGDVFEARVATHRYFSGPFERLTALANAQNPLEISEPQRFDGYSVELLDRDADGFAGIRFTLERPPGADGLHLFWGSKTRWAWQVTPGSEH
ncbi:MAG: hypothetical protein KDA32_13535 [Phycisphaerales bacterium]|nr:hypothetical protein [Phycisphaerales bacterium]